MKIQWMLVLAAGFLAELVLLAIYLPAQRYAGPAFLPIAIVDVIGSMFLAGLLVARRLRSQFLLHGVLIGIFANSVYALLRPLSAGWGHFLAVAAFKTLLCAAGAYTGGRLGRRITVSKPPF